MIGSKLTKNKSAPTIAQFLYEVMCRHRCSEIQIKDQDHEFVNKVCKQLHELKGVEQSYVCLLPSRERIGRTSKPNKKELFGRGFGR